MTNTDAGLGKESSSSSSELISKVDHLNHTVGCESINDQQRALKQIEGTVQPKTNKEPTPGLEDLVLKELDKLRRACQSKHMQPSMSAIRANLESLADRLQKGEPPLTDTDLRPRASSSTSN